MDLRKRVKAFINDVGATVTNFCKKTGISHSYYYQWMSGDAELSEGLSQNIEKYLNEVYAK